MNTSQVENDPRAGSNPGNRSTTRAATSDAASSYPRPGACRAARAAAHQRSFWWRARYSFRVATVHVLPGRRGPVPATDIIPSMTAFVVNCPGSMCPDGALPPAVGRVGVLLPAVTAPPPPGDYLATRPVDGSVHPGRKAAGHRVQWTARPAVRSSTYRMY